MNAFIAKIKPLLRYPLRQKSRLAKVLGLTLLSSVIAAAQPWPLKMLVDFALGQGQVPSWLDGLTGGELVILAALMALGVYIASTLIDAALTWMWAAAGERMVRDLAADLFDRYQRLSLLFHARRAVGDSLSRISEDTYSIYSLTNALLVSPTQQLLKIAIVGAVALALNPALTLIMLTAVPTLILAAAHFGPRLKQRAKVNREVAAELMSHIQQTLSSLPVVQAFCAEDRHRETYGKLADEAIVASRVGTLTQGVFGAVNGISGSFAIALVLAFGGLQVLRESLTVGGLLVFLQYAQTLRGAMEELVGTYGTVRSVEASVDRVLDVLDSDEAVVETNNAAPLPALAKGETRRRIAFESVWFGYEECRPILHDIDLKLDGGETVALVGPTGSGKTTLASLVPRFFDPWKGRVTLDGSDLRSLKLDAVRRSVAIVLQQPYLLPITIAENIAYSRPGATLDEVINAAKLANAHEFILRLDNGYETVVGERGATLSGGERQRLAIARALLRDAPIVILDEPTSSLDTNAELAVMDAIEKLARDRTMIIIAHRLSTARRADRVVVLDGGKIVEQGGHAELAERGGIYARYLQLQTGEVGPEAVL